MAPNPLDHSYLLDINLTVHAELADKFYDASELGGYKNKRLTQTEDIMEAGGKEHLKLIVLVFN